MQTRNGIQAVRNLVVLARTPARSPVRPKGPEAAEYGHRSLVESVRVALAGKNAQYGCVIAINSLPDLFVGCRSGGHL